MPLPLTGSTAETEVTLPEPSDRFFVIGKTPPAAMPARRSTGRVPVPSQPRLMVPNGARSVPCWKIVEL